MCNTLQGKRFAKFIILPNFKILKRIIFFIKTIKSIQRKKKLVYKI